VVLVPLAAGYATTPSWLLGDLQAATHVRPPNTVQEN
jgi:hypothetical protein